MITRVFAEPGCHEISLPRGNYFVELFGAQGGQCHSKIPYGGFTSGIIRNSKTKTYYICVGGKGQTGTSETISGGTNGGGNGKVGLGKFCAGGGGGQTDIRTKKNDFSSLIMVAGGGRGDSTYVEEYTGGRGGGVNGADGERKNDYSTLGTGGSWAEESFGKGGYYAGDTHGHPAGYAQNGTRGNGGDAFASSGASSGGGGGGYYGGGGGADVGAGGGGSGYFSSSVRNGKTGFSDKTGDGFASIQVIDSIFSCGQYKLGKFSSFLFVVIPLFPFS